MTDYTEVEHLLGTYTLDEILELNEITEEELLYFLLEEKFVDIPDPRPIDL